MNRTVLSSKTIPIGCFKHIVIGDPIYIEDYPHGSKDYKRLVADIKFNNNEYAYAKFSHVQYDDEICYDTYEVDIVAAPTYGICKTYLEDKYYITTNKHEIELGCDTAKYFISVDDKEDIIHTGADGYYGSFRWYTKNRIKYGCHLSLDFDPNLFTKAEVEKIIEYLFK